MADVVRVDIGGSVVPAGEPLPTLGHCRPQRWWLGLLIIVCCILPILDLLSLLVHCTRDQIYTYVLRNVQVPAHWDSPSETIVIKLCVKKKFTTR